MFYDKFLELCKRNNIKPTPAVKSMGLSAGNITRWKSGGKIKEDTIRIVASYFNVPVEYFFCETPLDKVKAPFYEKYFAVCYERGINPRGLAYELGVSPTKYNSWHNGIVPDNETIEKIADRLCISSDYLLSSNISHKILSNSEFLMLLGLIEQYSLTDCEIRQLSKYLLFMKSERVDMKPDECMTNSERLRVKLAKLRKIAEKEIKK